MRSLMDNYVYANPYIEPISLDALALPDGEDSEVICHPVVDPGADIDQMIAVAEARHAINAFLSDLMPADRELVERVFFGGQSQADVARHFRVSGAAISKRMTRIVARGRVVLADLRTSILLQ
jgi:DNA-directed RNA polymerase specialized sigma24 family protein